jgi:hypothetical protein
VADAGITDLGSVPERPSFRRKCGVQLTHKSIGAGTRVMVVLNLRREGKAGVCTFNNRITPDFREGCSERRNTLPVIVEGEAD